jgi:hypothetical protein
VRGYFDAFREALKLEEEIDQRLPIPLLLQERDRRLIILPRDQDADPDLPVARSEQSPRQLVFRGVPGQLREREVGFRVADVELVILR